VLTAKAGKLGGQRCGGLTDFEITVRGLRVSAGRGGRGGADKERSDGSGFPRFPRRRISTWMTRGTSRGCSDCVARIRDGLKVPVVESIDADKRGNITGLFTENGVTDRTKFRRQEAF